MLRARLCNLNLPQLCSSLHQGFATGISLCLRILRILIKTNTSCLWSWKILAKQNAVLTNFPEKIKGLPFYSDWAHKLHIFSWDFILHKLSEIWTLNIIVMSCYIQLGRPLQIEVKQKSTFDGSLFQEEWLVLLIFFG